MIGWFTVASGAEPDELLFIAQERARHGDYEGVRIVANQALEIPGDHQRTAQLLIALSLELGGDPEQALAIYDSLEDAWTPATVPDDLRFRRAECLGRLGRFEEASDELRALPNVERPALDQLKIDVLTGIGQLELGRERRATRRLTKTLDRAEPGVATYYQAAGRYAILDHSVDAANTLVFVGSDRAKARALEERATLLAVADEQLAGIIRTEETWFALEGFVENARARVRLGHDLLGESPLTGLSPEQLALNRSLLGEKVEAIWVKASLYYDRGMQLAALRDWTGPPVPTMKAEYDALIAEVDRL